VAPVLNWCSRIYLFPEDPAFQGPGREMDLSHLEAEERLSYLQDHGVTTLICGTLSPDLLHQGERLGLVIICGVAGDVEEVLESYWQNRLDQPQFRLPGCRVGRYRHNFRGLNCPEFNGNQGGKKAMPRGTNRGAGQGQGGRAPHERGIPCFQVNCPQCGKPMVRE
jgi:predicted Fe-Mo cluster-binding NifX family protein